MHRDISGGNILIYPRLVYDEAQGCTVVEWRGLLTDWEMSKSIIWSPSLGKRQPERTVGCEILLPGQ